MTTPKQDCEELLDLVLPFAKQMLSQYREFLPFGGTMSESGEMAHVGGWTESEHPPSVEVIDLLNSGFRAGAAGGKYRATALVHAARVAHQAQGRLLEEPAPGAASVADLKQRAGEAGAVS